jgi:(2Fe-2S) ferredoxin
LGPCSRGPVIVTAKDKIFYQGVSPDDAKDIVEKHLIKGEILEHLCWKDEATDKPIPVITDIDFFRRQVKIVLRNCGEINPLSIEEYIGRDGFLLWRKVVTEHSPEYIINEMKKSGLSRTWWGWIPYLC